jgi:hypothetical protein
MFGTRKANEGYEKYTYRFFVGKPWVSKSVRRPKGRWEDNIEMDLK